MFHSEHIVVCTAGKGFLDKYKIHEVEVFTAHFDSSSGLPDVIIDGQEKNTFYGSKDGPDHTQYRIGAIKPASEKEIQQYIKDRMPNKEVAKWHKYHDIRNEKNEIETIIERDKESELVLCFGNPSRTMPLGAQKVLQLISK